MTGRPEPSETTQDQEFDNFDDIDAKIPWHFWIGVGLVCLYLGFRLVQMLVLGFDSIF